MFVTLAIIVAAASSILLFYQFVKALPVGKAIRNRVLTTGIFLFAFMGLILSGSLLLRKSIDEAIEPMPAPPPPALAPTPTPSTPTFDFPPPPASASADINIRPFMLTRREKPLLGDLASHLSSALYEGGYTELSWYAVPNGFALVTRLEQFNKDGTPTYGAYRWLDDAIAPAEIDSIWDYLFALFEAKPGHYRVFVFIVTNASYPQSDTLPPTNEEVKAWLGEGVQNGLPPDIAGREVTPDYTCKAFVYEFVRPQEESTRPALIKSALTGAEHLQKSKIWEALRRP